MDKKFHKELGQLFEKKFIRENGGPSIMCDIYDKLTEGNEMNGNCLGENFNQLIQCIRTDFFKNYKPSIDTSVEFYFGTYIYWLYLIVERYEFVFEVINPEKKSKLINDYKVKHFKTFEEVKDWCIFYKHPKEFMFCHWPKFIFENDESGIQACKESESLKIDYKYVSENFTKNKVRLPNLENHSNVCVVLPELKSLTERFLSELKLFIDFICKNEMITDFLRKKTTIENYYKEAFELAESIVSKLDFAEEIKSTNITLKAN